MNNAVYCWIYVDINSVIKVVKTMFHLSKIIRKHWMPRCKDFYVRKIYADNSHTLVASCLTYCLKTDGSDSDIAGIANDINDISNIDGVLYATMY